MTDGGIEELPTRAESAFVLGRARAVYANWRVEVESGVEADRPWAFVAACAACCLCPICPSIAKASTHGLCVLHRMHTSNEQRATNKRQARRVLFKSALELFIKLYLVNFIFFPTPSVYTTTVSLNAANISTSVT